MLITKSDKVLVFLLRLVGVGSLFALVAVVMPSTWMAATHRWLGLGEMPTGPVVEYLARDLSAFYALAGALLLAMASHKAHLPFVSSPVARNRYTSPTTAMVRP